MMGFSFPGKKNKKVKKDKRIGIVYHFKNGEVQTYSENGRLIEEYCGQWESLRDEILEVIPEGVKIDEGAEWNE